MSAARSRSLVSTLSIRVALLLAGCAAAISAIALWSAKSHIYGIYDDELVTGSQLLHALVKEELEHGGRLAPGALLRDEDVESFDAYGKWRLFRIWHGSQLLAQSNNGPATLAAQGASGFVDVSDSADTWRIYHHQAADVGVSIAVGERLTRRDAVVQEFALTLIVPLLLLVPAGVGLVWLTLMDGLSALRRLAEALHAKSGRNLSPLQLPEWPRDLGGILSAINEMLDRLDRSFRQTLRFTDHAAHELRTPFAGLKLNAQMLEAEGDPVEQRAIIARIRAGAERGAALVEQLLTLARLDSGTIQSSPVDVTAVAKSVLEDYAAVAANKEIRLALAAATPVVARAEAALLRLIFSNLVGNAVKHSPAGAEVAVELTRDGDVVQAIVKDQGPGIPIEERTRVFERFYRIDDNVPGVGLGLSIAAEALAQIHGSISLEDAASGQGLWAVIRMRAA